MLWRRMYKETACTISSLPPKRHGWRRMYYRKAGTPNASSKSFHMTPCAELKCFLCWFLLKWYGLISPISGRWGRTDNSVTIAIFHWLQMWSWEAFRPELYVGYGEESKIFRAFKHAGIPKLRARTQSTSSEMDSNTAVLFFYFKISGPGNLKCLEPTMLAVPDAESLWNRTGGIDTKSAFQGSHVWAAKLFRWNIRDALINERYKLPSNTQNYLVLMNHVWILFLTTAQVCTWRWRLVALRLETIILRECSSIPESMAFGWGRCGTAPMGPVPAFKAMM